MKNKGTSNQDLFEFCLKDGLLFWTQKTSKNFSFAWQPLASECVCSVTFHSFPVANSNQALSISELPCEF